MDAHAVPQPHGRPQRAGATGRMSITPLLRVVAFVVVAIPAPAFAQVSAPNLSEVSIEELMSIQITSASRKEERFADVAGAIFVITRDDIRRSGMTTIPDLLRLAPGVDVAQINSNKWAVSVRGFNGLNANKLLVLVDGRSVYNKLFAGVFWGFEDPLLDDIDRIEVIRGPGAALWGANAVNGVVNIITKPTGETLGGLVRLDGGGVGEQGAVRYGATVRATRYRLYSQWTRRDQSLLPTGRRANDASHAVTAGFRADRTTNPGSWMVEGAVTAGQTRGLWLNLDPQTAAAERIANDPSDAQGGHFLGRWTHTRRGGAGLQIQSFVDIAERAEPLGHYRRRAFDVDTQYHTPIGARQHLVFGAGYRFGRERFDGQVGNSLVPAEDNSSLLTAFLHHQLVLFGDRLAVTLGSQVQHDSHSGAGVQPTARVMWKGLPRQRLWAATSRALRTASLIDRGFRLELPPSRTVSGLPLVVTLQGNPAAETETLINAEAGYRLDLGAGASVDVTGFVGRYDHLPTQEQASPIVRLVPSPHVLVTSRFGNQLEATTRGLEVAGHWMPVPHWRVDGSYTAFDFTPHLAAGSLDPLAARDDASAPRRQWQVRSAFSPVSRATLSVALFHVGPLEQFQVEGYTRADINAEWRFTSRLSAMAIGHNLFDPAHAEFGSAGKLVLATEVPRSASLRLRWTFR